MTEKLFYADAHMRKFTARVLSCEERGALYAVTLDRTAFFPEGGGQGGDTGALGGVRVTEAGGYFVFVAEKRGDRPPTKQKPAPQLSKKLARKYAKAGK